MNMNIGPNESAKFCSEMRAHSRCLPKPFNEEVVVVVLVELVVIFVNYDGEVVRASATGMQIRVIVFVQIHQDVAGL